MHQPKDDSSRLRQGDNGPDAPKEPSSSLKINNSKELLADLRSTNSATVINALQNIATTGSDSADVLDYISTIILSGSNSSSVNDAACHALLSELHESSLLGIRIEGIAKYLASAEPHGISEVLKRAVNFINNRSDSELLLSPTVFAISALNPELKLAPTRSADKLISQIRDLQRLGWSEGIDGVVKALDSSAQPELIIRSKLIHASHQLHSLPSHSLEAIRLRAEISLRCLKFSKELLSQTMGGRLVGSLSDATGNSVRSLMGLVGAASSEQLIRIASLPFPIKELGIGFHHDTGTFRASKQNQIPLEDQLKHALQRKLINESLSDLDESIGNSEANASLLSEFANRESEIIPRAQFDSTCSELISVLRSPAIRNIETINIPYSLLPHVTTASFPKLKRLEVFQASGKNKLSYNSLDSESLEAIEEIQLSRISLTILKHGSQLPRLKSLELTDPDDCFGFSQLKNSYGLHNLRYLKLNSPPSTSSFKSIISTSSLEELAFVWSDDLCQAFEASTVNVSRLSIESITSKGLACLSTDSFPNLQHVEMKNYQGTESDLLKFLDCIQPDQLESFAITSSNKLSKLSTVVQHPALRAITKINLGVSEVVKLMAELSSTPFGLTRLHSISFFNDAARAMESGDLSDIEEAFFNRFMTNDFGEIRYPWPLSESSTLAKISENPELVPFGKMNMLGAVKDITTLEQGGKSFIFWRNISGPEL